MGNYNDIHMLISYTRLTEYQLGPSTDKRLVAYISLSICDTQISVWTQIGIHWCHYLKSQSDLRIFSKWYPFHILRSMADLLVRAYVSDFIGRRFEKVRNSHRFENWTPIWKFEKRTCIDVCDVEIGRGFEDWMSIRVLYMYLQ